MFIKSLSLQPDVMIMSTSNASPGDTEAGTSLGYIQQISLKLNKRIIVVHSTEIKSMSVVFKQNISHFKQKHLDLQPDFLKRGRKCILIPNSTSCLSLSFNFPSKNKVCVVKKIHHLLQIVLTCTENFKHVCLYILFPRPSIFFIWSLKNRGIYIMVLQATCVA